MRALLAGVVIFTTIVMVSCDGDENGGAPTPQDSPTVMPTQPPPTPNDPMVPNNADELAQGELQLSVPPDEPAGVDPLAIAEEENVEPPPCAGFIFATSWLVTSPYPPGDVELEVSATRQGAAVVVGDSPSGGATTGCEVLEFENNSDVPLTIAVRYVIAEPR